jgi:hypothetical protein
MPARKRGGGRNEMTLILALGYNRNNSSPLLNRFLSEADELITGAAN